MTGGHGKAGAPRPADPGRLIAHRGASGAAPENTLAAFRLAREQGAAWVEFDVSLLGDGTPVIHHDATLDRCTDARGPLAAIGAADLSGIDAGGWFGAAHAGEPLPTLDAALDLLEALGLAANLEMKQHEGAPGALARAVAARLSERLGWAARMVVSSFEHDELAALRALLPEMPVAPLWEAPAGDWRETVAALRAGAVHLDRRALDGAFLAEARTLGLDVRVYTVNRPEEMAGMRDAGLTGLFTDHVPRFLGDPAWAAWARLSRDAEGAGEL